MRRAAHVGEGFVDTSQYPEEKPYLLTPKSMWSRPGYCHGRCLRNVRASLTPGSSSLRYLRKWGA
jgi:hypothetical protein